MTHIVNEMIRRTTAKMVLNPIGTDVVYNHGLRTATQFLAERGHVLDFFDLYPDRDNGIEKFIGDVVDKYLIQDPESNEEFAFNNGINDAIDIIRSYKYRR